MPALVTAKEKQKRSLQSSVARIGALAREVEAAFPADNPYVRLGLELLIRRYSSRLSPATLQKLKQYGKARRPRKAK